MRIVLCALATIGLLSAGEIKLGKPLTLKEPVTVATLLASPDKYLDKTVQVKGKITQVCQMMGCWMDLAGDDGKTIHIKVNDGEIVFPKDSAGKTAIAEGKLTKTEVTREEATAQAKHQAEESGKKFDPATVKGGVTYQIQGTGAVIVSN